MFLRSAGIGLAMLLTLTGTALSGPSTTAKAKGPKIPPITNLPYKPEPKYLTIPANPDPAEVPKANPTGQYNAYDLNVYETIHFPQRQPDDQTADDAPGGAIAHGVCPPEGCANHEAEFIKFWKKTMTGLVTPFGGTVNTYKFDTVGNRGAGAAPIANPQQPGGPTYNLQATIPGSVNPEQMVIVSGHYDQTDQGPASAWDSAEGHATVIRIAKKMIDYWNKTGTRPAVSVKFTAWGAEEQGTIGSIAYVRDNVTPFLNAKVRGYFNLDPCAGAYPAHYRGNPAYRVPMVMQLTRPDQIPDADLAKEAEAFNEQARDILGDVMNHLDDNLTDVPGEPEVFISDEEAEKNGTTSQEGEVRTALGGLLIFSSDYRNFEAIGVPIFNLFPDMLGPHAGARSTGHPDGITVYHSYNDNLRTVNALTGVDQTGLTSSQGWYKGMEFCAHTNAWFMLQPNMGGAVARDTNPIAYFEATLAKGPAPITKGSTLVFDADGSHAFADPKKGTLVPASKLKFAWDFDDGSKASGPKINHAFAKPGSYEVTLTVTAPGGKKDSMLLVVNVT